MTEYTTVALTDSDKVRLDELGERHFDGNPSYREIINHLVDDFEDTESRYEKVLARAIANADEDDVLDAVGRVERDKAFVEEVNEQ